MFDMLDANGDGMLEDYELLDGFVHEVAMHYANMTSESKDHATQVFWDHADEIVPIMDINGDGGVSMQEYEATHGHTTGKEQREAKAEEDAVGVAADEKEESKKEEKAVANGSADAQLEVLTNPDAEEDVIAPSQRQQRVRRSVPTMSWKSWPPSQAKSWLCQWTNHWMDHLTRPTIWPSLQLKGVQRSRRAPRRRKWSGSLPIVGPGSAALRPRGPSGFIAMTSAVRPMRTS